jgi:hypothetical protein
MAPTKRDLQHWVADHRTIFAFSVLTPLSVFLFLIRYAIKYFIWPRLGARVRRRGRRSSEIKMRLRRLGTLPPRVAPSSEDAEFPRGNVRRLADELSSSYRSHC